jgi:hypothetical protein
MKTQNISADQCLSYAFLQYLGQDSFTYRSTAAAAHRLSQIVPSRSHRHHWPLVQSSLSL